MSSKGNDPAMTFDDVAKKTEQFGEMLASIEALEISLARDIRKCHCRSYECVYAIH